MSHPSLPPARRTGFLFSAAVAQSVGTLFLLITGMVAGEMSMALSAAILAVAAYSAVGTVFLFRRRQWAWYLSAAVAALFTTAGLVLSLMEGLLWVGLIYALAGACVLGLLWAGRTALDT